MAQNGGLWMPSINSNNASYLKCAAGVWKEILKKEEGDTKFRPRLFGETLSLVEGSLSGLTELPWASQPFPHFPKKNLESRLHEKYNVCSARRVTKFGGSPP